MISKSKDVPIIVFSVRVYQWLLIAYPSGFRREYGSQMLEVFRDCCLRTFRQSGLKGMTSLWAITLIDFIRSLITEHLHKETSVTQTNFIRLSGWALMIGAAFFLPWLIMIMLLLTPYSFLLRGMHILELIALFGLFYGSILLTIGMLGLRARYSEQVGRLSKHILLMGAVGGVSLIIASILGWTAESEFEGYLFLGTLTGGLILLFMSLLFFGGLTSRQKPLPRGNRLPLAAGLSLPIYFKLYGMMASVRFPVDNPYFVVLSLIGFIVMTTALIRLGYILQASESYEAAGM